MRNFLRRGAISVLVLMLGGIAYAGLESVTHIQDLNSSWPLGSDLASTSDDHIRNIKSALKTDFPNFNGTYTSASLPVFAIPSDTNTGMYSVGADDLGFTTGGTLRLDISTTQFTGTLPWRGQDGLVGTPGISFSGDPDTGLYRVGANDLGISVGGARYMALNPSVGVSSLQVFGIPDGASNNPSLYFNSDGDTGFYRDTNNQIGIALAGVTAGQIVQGTFTGTLTGMSAGGTGTITYQRWGKLVYLTATAAVTGTSNTTAMTMTGIPAIIQPASTPEATLSTTTNNGGPQQTAGTLSGGTMTFLCWTGTTARTASGYIGSGTKGLPAGWTVTYSVD